MVKGRSRHIHYLANERASGKDENEGKGKLLALIGFELTINIKVPANSARNSLVVFDRIRSNIVTG